VGNWAVELVKLDNLSLIFKNFTKKIKKLFIFLAIFYISCKKQPDCKGTIIDGPGLSFILVNKGGSPLIGDYGRKYDAKYTKFENADGLKLYQFSIDGGKGLIRCNLVNFSSSQSVDSIFSTYYLKLPLPDTSLLRVYDTDTIKTVVRVEYNPVCKFYYLQGVTIIYNDSTYYKSSNQLPLILRFTKK
jgi:hypothetical protein